MSRFFIFRGYQYKCGNFIKYNQKEIWVKVYKQILKSWFFSKVLFKEKKSIVKHYRVESGAYAPLLIVPFILHEKK